MAKNFESWESWKISYFEGWDVPYFFSNKKNVLIKIETCFTLKKLKLSNFENKTLREENKQIQIQIYSF